MSRRGWWSGEVLTQKWVMRTRNLKSSKDRDAGPRGVPLSVSPLFYISCLIQHCSFGSSIVHLHSVGPSCWYTIIIHKSLLRYGATGIYVHGETFCLFRAMVWNLFFGWHQSQRVEDLLVELVKRRRWLGNFASAFRREWLLMYLIFSVWFRDKNCIFPAPRYGSWE